MSKYLGGVSTRTLMMKKAKTQKARFNVKSIRIMHSVNAVLVKSLIEVWVNLFGAVLMLCLFFAPKSYFSCRCLSCLIRSLQFKEKFLQAILTLFLIWVETGFMMLQTLKNLAFDGYFISLYHLHLTSSPLVLHDRVKKSVPPHWDPAALSR